MAISRDWIEWVVRDFYHTASEDILIGYFFERVDMMSHIPKIISFWHYDLMLSTQSSPLPPRPDVSLIPSHQPMVIRQGHLDRWVVLFEESLRRSLLLFPETEVLVDPWKKSLKNYKRIFEKHLVQRF
jgi:truncated hemoglobin YjbI